MLSPLRFVPSPSGRARRLLLSASVAALFATGFPSAAQAGDVLIGPGDSYSVPVYGNSEIGDPTDLNTDAEPSNNTLTIDGASISNAAYGAKANQAGQESSQNALTIKNGGSAENAYGGYSSSGAVTDNSVTISGSSSVSSVVIGGYSYDDAATGNSVTISGGTFSGTKASGGFSYDGDATGNSVTISGGTFSVDEIYGGFSDSGTASNNSVTINNTAIGNNQSGSASLYGGYSEDGDATGNSITINGASSVIDRIVYGGVTNNYGDASNNSLTINGGSFAKAVYGGLGKLGTASNNSITISRGHFDQRIYGGSSTDGDASNNSIAISGGSFSGTVYGGATANDDDASNNSITISGGSLEAGITGGAGVSGAASNNTITISGGSFSDYTAIFGGRLTSGAATNNTVNILGGTLVTGGGGGLFLIGGDATHSGDAFTGNVLNLHGSGQTAYFIENFEYLNFYLPTTVADDDIVLKVTDTAKLISASGKSSVVNVGIDGGSSPLAVGDTITLIRAGTLVETNDDLNDTADGTGMQGVTLEYAFEIAADARNLTATVTSAGTTESSKALSEGGTVQAAVVNQGSDLSSGSGMANAIGAARSSTASFSAMSGGSVRTETGSHVDVTGVSLLAGLSGTFELLDNMVVAAPYLEYGYGAYDTYNTFASGSVHGTGNSSYVGAGVLAHMDLLETEAGHAYVEGGARAGVAYNSFNSADLVSGGVSAQYDASSAYYGLNAGLGYVWNLTEESSLDIYGQYSWNELGSDSVTLSTGDTVNFDAIDSHRVRLGARYSYEISEQATPYVDVAWEHEFDGSVSATTNGLAIAEPSLSGDTGIFSAGLKLTPSEDLPLTLDFNVTGYVGRNQGISGGLQAKVAF